MVAATYLMRAMARLELTLLGGFQARLEPGSLLPIPTRKAQALVGYLAMPAGQAHLRDTLAALLWGDLPREPARRNVRQTLFVIQKALRRAGRSCLRLEGETVALDPSAVEIDVAAFERGVAKGTPEALEDACALYRGELLEGLALGEAPFEEWLMTERDRLRERALEGLARLLAHRHRTGATDAAIQTALRLLALDPLEEAVHRMLMRLYAEHGRRGAALRHYQHCVGVLQRELGVEPEAETKQLYQDVLRQRPARGVAVTASPEAQASTVLSRTVTGAAPEAPPVEAPLIGRAPELARLRAALDGVWNGRGSCLAIVGEAGVGKSRLVIELATEAVQRGARVLLGRSYDAEQIFPFGPWVDALRYGQVARDVDALRHLAPVWRAELARLLPDIGSSPASDSDSLHLFESVAELLALLAAPQPLLVVLEDLHWADEMSVKLMAFLARRLHPVRALLVITAREEEVGDAPGLRRTIEDLSRERDLRQITAGPLSRADTISLVSALVRPARDPNTVEQLGQQVWLASEGNPFVAVEYVRALTDGATPAASGGLPLPDRVRQVIARRLERLGEGSRQLVAAAAVIGREFTFPLLQVAAGLDEARAAEGLEELIRRRVLHEVEERFDFTHDAIRQVVLAELLLPRRKLLHRRVAEAIETVYARDAEPHALTLGIHYRQGEVWGKAAIHLGRAGAHAVAHAAHREALAAYEQALDALAHLPESRETVEQGIDLRIALYKALIPLGQPQRSGAYLLEAEASALALGDQARLGRIAAYLTNFFWLSGEADRALVSGERARALAETLGDRTLAIAANFYLGQACHFRGDYHRAINVLRQTRAALAGDVTDDRAGLPGLAAVLSRGWLAWSLSEVGEFAEGIACGEEALAIAQRADHAFSLADASRELGCLYIRKGEIAAAMAILEPALALCRARQMALWVPSLGSALGYAYALAGKIDAATALLEQSLEQAAAGRIAAGHSLRSAWLGEAYLFAGRLIEAQQLAERAIELARQRNERGNEGWALRLLGEIEAHRAPGHPATETYAQALAVAQELSMRPLVAHCHLGLGKLYRRSGKPQQAQEHFATAAAMYREIEMTYWLRETDSEVAALG